MGSRSAAELSMAMSEVARAATAKVAEKRAENAKGMGSPKREGKKGSAERCKAVEQEAIPPPVLARWRSNCANLTKKASLAARTAAITKAARACRRGTASTHWHRLGAESSEHPRGWARCP